MRDHGRHGPGEHRMSRGKGSVEVPVPPESAIPGALVRTLTSRRELHGRVDQECIGQRLQREFAKLLGVGIVLLDAPCPDTPGCHTGCPQGQESEVVADIDVIMRNIPHDLPIGGEEGRRAYQGKSVPLQVLGFERCAVEFLLVLEPASHIPHDESMRPPVFALPNRALRWVFRNRRQDFNRRCLACVEGRA